MKLIYLEVRLAEPRADFHEFRLVQDGQVPDVIFEKKFNATATYYPVLISHVLSQRFKRLVVLARASEILGHWSE